MSYMGSLPKYADVFTVVDSKQFNMWNNNVTKTTQMVTHVHALVYRYVKEVNMTVLLTGLKVWTERNLVKISLNL